MAAKVSTSWSVRCKRRPKRRPRTEGQGARRRSRRCFAPRCLGDARYAKAGGELALDLGDRATAALAVALMASVNGVAGRYNEAEGERALRLARQVGEPWLVCEGLLALGLSVDVRSRPGVERAQAVLEELLATAEESGDIYFIYAAETTCARTASFTTTPELSPKCREAKGTGR